MTKANANNSFAIKFVEVLQARQAEKPSADLITSINNLVSGQVAVDLAIEQGDFAEIMPDLLKNARLTVKSDNFIAVKALVKIVKLLTAIGQNLKSEVDPYSRVIIENIIDLNQITNRGALVSLSREIVYDMNEASEKIRKRYSCGASTATTQASSTRMMLKHLGICEIEKGKVNDIAKIFDNERSACVMNLMLQG